MNLCGVKNSEAEFVPITDKVQYGWMQKMLNIRYEPRSVPFWQSNNADGSIRGSGFWNNTFEAYRHWLAPFKVFQVLPSPDKYYSRKCHWYDDPLLGYVNQSQVLRCPHGPCSDFSECAQLYDNLYNLLSQAIPEDSSGGGWYNELLTELFAGNPDGGPPGFEKSNQTLNCALIFLNLSESDTQESRCAFQQPSASNRNILVSTDKNLQI